MKIVFRKLFFGCMTNALEQRIWWSMNVRSIRHNKYDLC